MLSLILSVAWAAEAPVEDATRWAPVFYQDLADGLLNDPANRRRDLIAPIDFDGNYDPFDNAENADSGLHPLTGSILYDVVETETHLYLLYSIFHPIDWNTTGAIDHENDMEQVWNIVQKNADGTRTLSAVLTQAHGQLLAWSDSLSAASGFSLSAGGMELEGERPRIFIEPKGHGPVLCSFPGGLPLLNPVNCTPTTNEDLVIYRPLETNNPAPLSEPETNNGLAEASYALVWGYETLWPFRANLRQDNANPPLWEDPFTWIPTRNTDSDLANNLPLNPTAVGGLGSRMAGDEGGGAGTPPWGYLVAKDVLALGTVGERGDWLLDPPTIHALLFDDPCAGKPGFYNYLFHPYLDDLLQPGSPLPHDGIDQGRRCDGIEDTTTDTATPDSADTQVTDTSGSGADTEGSNLPEPVPDQCGCATHTRHQPLSMLGLALLFCGLRREARLGSHCSE